MNQIEKIITTHAAALLALGVALAIVNPVYFEERYIVEDGLLEWLTALALASAAFVCATRVVRDRRLGWRRWSLPLMFTVAFVFGAGEEVSWGQRLFNIGASEFFATHNAQGETNLHNLVVGGVKINKLIFSKGIGVFFLFYLGVLTPLYHRVAATRAFVDRWGIPIPKRYQWLGYLIALVAAEGVVAAFADTGKRGELTEFGVSVLVVLNVIFPANLKPR